MLAASDSFYIFRKFSRARARLLLLKQDKISVLEREFDKVDLGEQCPLFLGKSRLDINAGRLAILADIDTSLADYGEYRPDMRSPPQFLFFWSPLSLSVTVFPAAVSYAN